MSQKVKYQEYKNLNFPEFSDEILKFWEENKIFEESVDFREGRKPYIFYEGPPSANGTPGIHHVMARAIKDIFCRYKTMSGYQVKRSIWEFQLRCIHPPERDCIFRVIFPGLFQVTLR